MSNLIEIPGYEIIEPNSSYERSGFIQHPKTSGINVPSIRYLRLARCTLPTKQEYLDNVVEIAESIFQENKTVNQITDQEMEMYRAFASIFNLDQIKDVIKREDRVMNLLESSFFEDSKEDGRSYINVQRLDAAVKSDGKIEIIQPWIYSIGLRDGFRMPPKDTIIKSAKKLNELARREADGLHLLIHEAITTPEQVLGIPDTSKYVLNHRTTKCLEEIKSVKDDMKQENLKVNWQIWHN